MSNTWPIRSLHQIELTSHCNLRCVYCTSPTLGRPKLDMDEATFERCLHWVRHFVREGTQGDVDMAGIGESTLHPKLPQYLMRVREIVGWERKIVFATNGLLITPELVEAMKPAKPWIAVSMHRPEKAKPAIDLLGDVGMLMGASMDLAISAVNWAGQVGWKVTTTEFGNPCPWRHLGWTEAMADGRLTACAFDSDGSGVFGHVNDEPGSVTWKPYRLCRDCHLDTGIDGWRDRVEGRVKV
jgi:hypothetical protein